MSTEGSIPPAPDPDPDEIWTGTPNVISDGERYAIGWQRFAVGKGGEAYVTSRRRILGGRKVLERYPLTADGWTRAWSDFARLDPVAAEQTRAVLAVRSAESVRLRGARSTLAGLSLKAIDPPADDEFTVGETYDLRASENGLQISRSGSSELTAEFRYADVAAVQVTGFERVPYSTAAAFFVPLRVETVDRTLDFCHTAPFWGADFSHWLEPVSRSIREACLSAAADAADRDRNEWFVSELSRLAERLEHGTLTRSDFELVKARIAAGY